jgi:hypothetical protein
MNDPKQVAARFIDEQFQIMQRYGGAPAPTAKEYKDYENILQQIEVVIRDLQQRREVA